MFAVSCASFHSELMLVVRGAQRSNGFQVDGTSGLSGGDQRPEDM